jgi:hypothetical protein
MSLTSAPAKGMFYLWSPAVCSVVPLTGYRYISHALLLHLRLPVTLVESSAANTQAAQRRFDACKSLMQRRKGQEHLNDLAVAQLRACKGFLGLLPETVLRQVASHWLRGTVPIVTLGSHTGFHWVVFFVFAKL